MDLEKAQVAFKFSHIGAFQALAELNTNGTLHILMQQEALRNNVIIKPAEDINLFSPQTKVTPRLRQANEIYGKQH